MDGPKPRTFGGQPDNEAKAVDSQPVVESSDPPPNPRKRKSQNKKFIDLQKQPPKPKPLVQE